MDNTFICLPCEMGFPSFPPYRQHVRRVHHRYPCMWPACGKHFTGLTGVKTHYDGVHVGVRFQCSGCPKSYSERSSWRKHRNQTDSPCAAATATRVAPVPFDLLAEDLYLSETEAGPEVEVEAAGADDIEGQLAAEDAEIEAQLAAGFVMPVFDMPPLLSPIKSSPASPMTPPPAKRKRGRPVSETPVRAPRDDVPITPGRNLFAGNETEERRLWCTLCDGPRIYYPTTQLMVNHLLLMHPDA